jgi:hypothetical protein
MSNSLSVAAVTASIADVLRFVLAEHNGGTVPGAVVTHLALDNPTLDGGSPAVNVYLLSAGVETAPRNDDLPARRPDGARVETPRLPLSLSYLVTFHGDHSKLEPQRLMGTVAIALHAQPVLGPALLAHTVSNSGWLAGCDLPGAEGIVSVLLAPFSDPEQMGRFWMNFAGVPHRLALLYTASVVTLDANVPPVVAPPVREVGLILGAAGPETVPAPLRASFEVVGHEVIARVTPEPATGTPATLYLNALEPPQRLLHRIAGVAGAQGAGLAFDVAAVPPGRYLALVVAEGAWSGRISGPDGLTGPVVTIGTAP